MSGLLALAKHADPIAPFGLTVQGRTVLLFAPHPDDETLGCGASIAALADKGIAVQVVLVTDGGASHPASILYPPARLAALRLEELKAALNILTGGRALAPITLGYPDLAAPDTDAQIDCAARRIADQVTSPVGAVWTTWAGDPHPDHGRTARLARHVLRLFPDAAGWAYPIWGRVQGDPDMPALSDLRLVHLPHMIARKRRAIAAHASQMSALIPDDPTGFRMSPADQAHFAKHPEIFIRLHTNDE